MPRLDQLHAERKAFLADDPPNAVEAVLVVVAGLAAPHALGELFDRTGQVEGAAVDQAVEEIGALRQRIGSGPR